MVPPLVDKIPINANGRERATFYLRIRNGQLRLEGVSFLRDAGGLLLTVGPQELGTLRMIRPRFVNRDALQNG